MGIRPMTAGDIPALAAIEAASPSPWSIRQITAEHTRTGGIILVAQSSSHGVLGWCCAHCVGP
ncbi:MAG: hypothetical protein ABFR63_11885, partial [Thermodesulfobacteriota bacterium]